MTDEAKALKVALLVAALLLCFAVIPTLPRDYFTLLRLTVCGAAVYGAFKLKSHASLRGHVAPLGVVAVLFNPFFPVPLTPLIWLVMDLGVAVYFLQLSKKI